MTTAQMIAETRATARYDQDPVRLLDNSGTLVEQDDARIVGYLNEAVDALGVLCKIRAIVTLTALTGVSSYDLRSSAFSKRVVKIVRIGTGGQANVFLCESPPIWGAANGTPLRYMVAERALTLNPAPASNMPLTVDAYVLPDRLTTASPNAECGLPEEIHRAACRWAAAEMSRPNATEAQQRVRLSDEQQLAERKAVEIGRRSVTATAAPGHRGPLPRV